MLLAPEYTHIALKSDNPLPFSYFEGSHVDPGLVFSMHGIIYS